MAPRASEERPAYYRKTGGGFQPRFTLGILYLFGFFYVYCRLLVAPALFEVWQTVPIGPEQAAAADQVTREVLQPRLWIAVLLAALTTVLGAHYRLLPGLRERR